MTANHDIEPFRAAIESIHRLLAHYNNRGVIIGGIAVGFLGRPRLTEDVDAMFLLSIQEIPCFLEDAAQEGILPRIPDAEPFARKNRVLLLKHGPTSVNIDISLGVLPFEEEVVNRSQVQSSATLSVRLPTPEDLIVMKAVAHRPKDLEDIRTIVEKQTDLDKEYIKNWIQQFAEILEIPSLWEDIAAILK